MEEVTQVTSGLLDFGKSPLFKKLLIALVIIVIVVFLWNKYQRKIYSGFTKSEVIKEVAKLYAISRIEAHKNEGFSSIESMANWYDENSVPNIADSQIKKYLTVIGVDYVKHPTILNISSEVNKIAYLKNYI